MGCGAAYAGRGRQACRGLGAHSTTGPGSGIGLRLCRLLAERAGGSLDVVRDGPEGTELVLRLPTHPN